jgi:hypothetical protein
MELHAYLANESGHGRLYEDAGDGYGDSVTKTFVLKGEKLIQSRSGEFQPKYSSYRLMIHGAAWKKISVDGGKEIPLKRGEFVEIPESFQEVVFS